MQIGMIGLGRMGMNMARRWLAAKHNVVVYNRTAAKVEEVAKDGAIGTTTLEDFVKKLNAPRIVWLMLPTGPVLEEHLQKLSTLLILHAQTSGGLRPPLMPPKLDSFTQQSGPALR